MGKTGIIALVTIIILAMAGGTVALTRSKDKPATIPQSNASSTSQPASGNDKQSDDTITYSNSGFSPATLSVKSGAVVTIKNNSSSLLQFDSAPHPDHTDDPEINIGVIAPGQSKTVTVIQTGTHGYHNHSNPDDTGTLIVQ